MTDDVAALIKRTNDLLSVLVKTQLRSIVAEELADVKKRKLYELTGNALPITEIAKRVDMSTGAISRTWQHWDDIGLALKRNGKYRRTLE